MKGAAKTPQGERMLNIMLSGCCGSEYAVESRTPAVIATTGLGEAHIALIYEAAKNIPIFFSANMSLGINLLCELAKTAARVLGNT